MGGAALATWPSMAAAFHQPQFDVGRPVIQVAGHALEAKPDHLAACPCSR